MRYMCEAGETDVSEHPAKFVVSAAASGAEGVAVCGRTVGWAVAEVRRREGNPQLSEFYIRDAPKGGGS